MNRSLRYIIVFFTFVASYIFIFWIPLSFIPGLINFPVVHYTIAAVVAIGITILVWKKTSAKKNIISHIFLGGVITGIIMFILGFISPLIFSPHATLGPMLGFVTGPLGLILGMIGGAVYFIVKNKRNVQSPQ